jgi:hypothetical protein
MTHTEFSSRGGKRAAGNMTKAERIARARAAGLASAKAKGQLRQSNRAASKTKRAAK